MRLRTRFLLLAAVAGSMAWAVAQQKEGRADPTDFVRFVEAPEAGIEPGAARFETAIVSYGREDGARVDLIGAVHVADGKYYETLDREFRSYDSLLYELIKDEHVKVRPGERSTGLLSFLQRTLKSTLDLEFQLDAIDYNAANFVHADLDPGSFLRLQAERGESFFTLIFQLLNAEMAAQAKGEKASTPSFLQVVMAFSSPDSARRLKLLLGRQLENMLRLAAGLEEGKNESVIVTERNKVALRKLGEALGRGEKRLGIFYGAAHMPDMERRLVGEFGFRRESSRWLTAWDIPGPKPKAAVDGASAAGEHQGEDGVPRK